MVADGNIVPLANYPYLWNGSEYPGFIDDLSDWLTANGHYFSSIDASLNSTTLTLEIKESSLAIERINGPTGQAIFNLTNCQDKVRTTELLALHALTQLMNATTLANTNFPVVIYEVEVENGSLYHLTGPELAGYQDGYTIVACDTVSTTNDLIEIVHQGSGGGPNNTSTITVQFAQWLSMRQTDTFNLTARGACGPPPPFSCTTTMEYTQHQTAINIFYALPDDRWSPEPLTNFEYYTFLNVAGTIVYTNFPDSTTLPYQFINFTDQPLPLHATAEYIWEVGAPIMEQGGQSVVSYSVEVDVNSFKCKEGYLGLYDGQQFIPINGGLPYLSLDANDGFFNSPIVLTPDVLPSLEQMAVMQFVLFSGCNGTILDVHATVGYEGPCQPTPLCETPASPTCSPEEIAFQLQSIEAIKSAAETLVIENLPMPNNLLRVVLCDGTPIYLLEHELALLQGNYDIVQWIGISSPNQTFSMTPQGETTLDAFAMRLYYQENKPSAELDGIPQKNGNISNISWQSRGRQIQRYGFSYDDLDRLTGAIYKDRLPDATWATDNKYTVSNITYDKNGNLKTLARQGLIQPCPGTPQYGFVDILNYGQYQGNQVGQITDAAPLEGGVKANV
ncbi:MAG: hypothetical protein AAGD05_15520, partial [Bacteroidota bacterium]